MLWSSTLLLLLVSAACGSPALEISSHGATAPEMELTRPGSREGLVLVVSLGGRSAEQQFRRYGNIVKHLREEMHRDVRLVLVRDQVRIADLLATGACDFGFVNMSVRNAGSETLPLVAAGIPSQGRRALIVVRRDSLLYDFKDLRGKLIAVAAPGRSDAAAFVSRRLQELQSPAAHFFGSVRRVTDFPTCLRLLAQGRVDAACVNSEAFLPVPDEFRVIDQSNELPGELIVASTWTPQPIVHEMRRVVEALPQSDSGRLCLAALQYSRFLFDGVDGTSARIYGRRLIEATRDFPLERNDS